VTAANGIDLDMFDAAPTLGQYVLAPPGVRGAVLREQGAQALRARYAPLLAAS